MTYTPITSVEADPDSPLTTTLMTKIKDNLGFLKSKTDGIPAAAWSGLKPAVGVDTAHDVTVASGTARDTTDAATLVLASALTKRLDMRWAGGPGGGGLANAPLINLNTTVSFDTATSKILGTGLFGGVAAGDTIIVEGSAANSGIHEITAATVNDATLSAAPVTEGAGQAITVYIVKANWLYSIFIADDGVGGTEIGFDDAPTAANFLTQPGVGTLYRGIGYIETDASANISELVWVGDVTRTVFLEAPGTTSIGRTWIKPAMLHSIEFIDGVAGGGGSEGSDPITAGNAGGRGGSGAVIRHIKAADIADAQSVQAGGGGTAGVGSGVNGGDGGSTLFGGLLILTGGQGGADPGGADGSATGAEVLSIFQLRSTGGYTYGAAGPRISSGEGGGIAGSPGYLLYRERFA